MRVLPKWSQWVIFSVLALPLALSGVPVFYVPSTWEPYRDNLLLVQAAIIFGLLDGAGMVLVAAFSGETNKKYWRLEFGIAAIILGCSFLLLDLPGKYLLFTDEPFMRHLFFWPATLFRDGLMSAIGIGFGGLILHRHYHTRATETPAP